MKLWKIVLVYVADLFVFTLYLLAIIFLFLGAIHWLIEDAGFRIVPKADGAPAPFLKPVRPGREADPELAFLGCHIVDNLWVVQLHPKGKYECWDINDRSRRWVGTWRIYSVHTSDDRVVGCIAVKERFADSGPDVGYSDWRFDPQARSSTHALPQN